MNEKNKSEQVSSKPNQFHGIQHPKPIGDVDAVVVPICHLCNLEGATKTEKQNHHFQNGPSAPTEDNIKRMKGFT